MVSRLLLRYPYLIWLLGFLMPVMYLAYLLNINRLLHNLKKVNSTMLLFLCFTLVQLLSALLAISYSFFTPERFLAIMHNIIAFTFIFLGYSFMQDEKLKFYIKRYSFHVYLLTFLLILAATIYSLYFDRELILPSVFSLAGIDSKFTEVKLNGLDWYMISNFPRTQVLGIYPNSTGLLFIFLYVIVMSLNFYEFTWKRKVLITTMLVVVCFLTGSRTFWLLSASFFLLLFIRNKSRLSFIAFFTPFLAVAGLVAIEFLLTLRPGSNEARSMIYEGSFNFMMEVNPIFGLGIKPYLPEVIGVPFPLGSHSTIWGYVVKCGLVGIIFMLFLVGAPIFRYMEMLVLQLFSKNKFNEQKFFILSSIVIVIIALGMEDLDAFEILPLYFGMIVWIYDNRGTLQYE